MLTRAPVTTILPVIDMDRAREWFKDTEGNILCIHQRNR